MWNATVPSRFIDELPEDAVEVTEAKGGFGGSFGNLGGYGQGGGSYGASRFDTFAPKGSKLLHAGLAARAEAQARRR
jgi:DNA helicase II / ATP-dependent DNA helicase PcrA